MTTRSTKKNTETTTLHHEPDQDPASPVEPESLISATSAETVSEAPAAALADQELAELEELRTRVLRLGEEVQSMKVETARNAAFQKAIAGVKEEVTATRALLAVPGATGVEYAANPHLSPCEQESGCKPCECVNSKCCTFDVIMTHFRVVHMQSPLEITDTNLVPTNELELRFFGSIDPINNIGAIIPDPTGWVTGRKGLLEPIGMWVPVYRKIGTKCVVRGSSEPITIELIVIEVETPIESVVFNRDEYGSASETVTLDCCYSNYPPVIITVALTGGGLNIAPGVIDAKFSIVKSC